MQDLKNVLSAREFVWWFNGHPDGATLPVDLSTVRCCLKENTLYCLTPVFAC